MIGGKSQNKDYEIQLIGGLSSKREAIRRLMEVKFYCLAKKYLSQEKQDEVARRLKGKKDHAERPDPRPEPDSHKPHKRKCELDKVQGEMKDIKKVFECLFLVELDFFTLSCVEATQRAAAQPNFDRSLNRVLRNCLIGAILMVLSDPQMLGEQQTLAFVEKVTGSNELTAKGKRRAILVKKLIEEDYGNNPDFLDRVVDNIKLEVCLQEAAVAGSLPTFEELCRRLDEECKSEAEVCARLVKALFVRFLIPASICVATDLPDEIEVSATVFDHTEILGRAPRCGLILLNEANKVTPFFGLLPAKLRFKENFLQASLEHPHNRKQSLGMSAGLEPAVPEKETATSEKPPQNAPGLLLPQQTSVSISNRQLRQVVDFTFNQDQDFEAGHPQKSPKFSEPFLEERKSADFGKRFEDPPNVFATSEPIPPAQIAPVARVCIPGETATAVEECMYFFNRPEPQTPAGSIQTLIQKYTESINSMLEMQRELENDGKISRMRRRFQKVELIKKMSSVLDLMDSNSQKIDLSTSIVDSRKIALQALQPRGAEKKGFDQPALESSAAPPQQQFGQPRPLLEAIDRYRLPPAKEQTYRYLPLATQDNSNSSFQLQKPFSPSVVQPAPRTYQANFQQAYQPHTFDREATSFVQYPVSNLNTSYVTSHQMYQPAGLPRSASSANFIQETPVYSPQVNYTDVRSYKDILPASSSFLSTKNTYIRR